jgi:uncharacterized protein YgbK (DUF1537 family)
MSWAAVADDLTGAADLASNLARPGAQVLVSEQLQALRGEEGSKVFDAGTRFLGAEEARRRVDQAWRSLDEPRGRLWRFQKIDSTLRGNPGAEIEGFLQASAAPWIAILPAYPSLGRQVVNGGVRVHGQPLLRTEYARDPLSPARQARVPALFPRGLSAHAPLRLLRRGPVALGTWLRQRPRRARFISFDCATPADVDLIAGACLRAGGRHFAGASALGAALARRLDGPPQPVRAPHLPWCFILGTVSASAFAQLEHAQALKILQWAPRLRRDARGWHVLGAQARELLTWVQRCGGAAAFSSFHERAQLAAWLEEGERRGFGREAWAERSLQALVDEARALVPGLPRIWFAAGGHTLSLFLRAQGWDRLRVLGALTQGVPLSQAEGSGGQGWVASRPGGFGGPSALADLLLLPHR